MFWNELWEIMTITTVWELLLIFFAKIIEVTIGTLRSILIIKGYRLIAFFLALIEITIWIFVASTVITGLTESPMKGIAYAIGFASGVYLGSIVENKLAFGRLLIQTITSDAMSLVISEKLRELGCGVTSVAARGKDEARTILMIYSNRRASQKIIDQILTIDPAAMIVLNDISTMVGGYFSGAKSIHK